MRCGAHLMPRDSCRCGCPASSSTPTAAQSTAAAAAFTCRTVYHHRRLRWQHSNKCRCYWFRAEWSARVLRYCTRGLTGDAEQQRRSGNSKRALGAHALRIRWSLLRELRANVMMKQHRCNGQIKSPSSCSLMRDCRANYIQNAVCHGAAGRHVAAVTCSA